MTIRSLATADDAVVAALLGNLNRHLPPLTGEEFRAEIEMIPPGVKSERLVAQRGDEIVGYGSAGQQFWTGQPNTYSLALWVASPWQSQGIGGSLYPRLLTCLREWGAERVYADVREDLPASREFAERRGFVESGHAMRLSRLAVREAQLEGTEESAGGLHGKGIRVERLVNLGPEDEQLLRAVHEVSMVTAEDEPSPEPYNVPFDQWLEMIRGSPGMSPETIWIALHGDRPIGLTMLRRLGTDNGFQFSMGVLREYRGQGVACLIKLRQIEWARDNGVTALYTGNDINNPRMYDINVRLGYQPLLAMISMVLSL